MKSKRKQLYQPLPEKKKKKFGIEDGTGEGL